MSKLSDEIRENMRKLAEYKEARKKKQQPVEPEPQHLLTRLTFDKFARFIYEKTGIVMKETKRTLLSNRLRRRLKALALDSFNEYWSYLQQPRQLKQELPFFLDVVSTNETYFRRGTNHFDILQRHVFTEFARQNKSHLHIWSAGCSTGEEPYDLAITVDQYHRQHRHRFYANILATDISKEVLDYARRGEYADRKIAKLDRTLRERHFNRISPEESSLKFAHDVLKVKDSLKRLVNFRFLNLMKDSYPPGQDVIFCRNVLIYFDRETQNSVLNKMYNSLNHGGYLMIGHSETLQIHDTQFKTRRMKEGVCYQKA